MRTKTHKLQQKSVNGGFTLIELLVTVSIATVLMGVAIPSLKNIIVANRIQGASAEFQSALAMARGEAIKRGGDAHVTVVANSKIGTAPNWQSGVTVFYDTTSNANNDAPPSSASVLLMKTSAFSDNVTVSVNFPHLIYNGLGRSINSVGAPLAGVAAFGADGTDWHCNIISLSGRARVARITSAQFGASGCPTN